MKISKPNVFFLYSVTDGLDASVSEAVLNNSALLIPLKSCLSLQFSHNKDRLLTRNLSFSNKTSLKLSQHIKKKLKNWIKKVGPQLIR